MTFDNDVEEPKADRQLDLIVESASHRYTKAFPKQFTNEQKFGVISLVSGGLFLLMSAGYTLELAKLSHNYSEGIYCMLASAGLIGFGAYLQK